VAGKLPTLVADKANVGRWPVKKETHCLTSPSSVRSRCPSTSQTTLQARIQTKDEPAVDWDDRRGPSPLELINCKGIPNRASFGGRLTALSAKILLRGTVVLSCLTPYCLECLVLRDG
jgi:hypothetical protein